LIPTAPVRRRNQGDTRAASSALRRVTVPAIAKRTRSSGQRFVDELLSDCGFAVVVIADLLDRMRNGSTKA
jgi:hypothetical protein